VQEIVSTGNQQFNTEYVFYLLIISLYHIYNCWYRFYSTTVLEATPTPSVNKGNLFICVHALSNQLSMSTYYVFY